MKKALLALVAVLVLAEIGLRLFGSVESGVSLPATPAEAEFSTFELLRPSEMPELLFELRPGLRGLLAGRWIETNSHGMRGREVSRGKPDGVFRIAGFGDAQMFGTGVAQRRTFLDLVERELNDRASVDREVEVLNFATPGFNTAQEVAMFEARALAFEPDLAIVHFVGDDFTSPRFVPSGTDSGSEPALRLWGFVRSKLSGSPESDQQAELVRASDAIAADQEPWADLDAMRGREGFESALERLAMLSAENNVPVLFVVLGDGSKQRQAMKEAVVARGFEYLNVLPTFSEVFEGTGQELTTETWKRTFFTAEDRPNVAGHRAYARALVGKLVELGV